MAHACGARHRRRGSRRDRGERAGRRRGTERERADPDRHRLLANGCLCSVRRGIPLRSPLGPGLRNRRHGSGQRPQGRAHDRRRRDRHGQGRLRREGPDRPGVQDHRRKRVLWRSALASRPLPSRTRSSTSPGLRDGRGHGGQRVHLPLGPPDLPGRQGLDGLPEGRRRQERRRLRPGHRFRAGQRCRCQTSSSDLSGQKVDRVLVPASAQDFTPYAQQLRQKNPDLVFVAWAGTERAGDVDRARPAGRLRHRGHHGHRPRRAGDVADVRAGGREDQVPEPLQRDGAQEPGQRLARRRR